MAPNGFFRKATFASIALAVLLVLPVAYLQTADRTASSQDDPLLVVGRYLRASYARDYKEAYRHIASADRRIKDLNRYARERGAFNGFALTAARKLAEFAEFTPMTQQVDGGRAQVTVRFKVPDANRLSSLLLSWDPYQLNSLPAAKQNELLESLDRLKREDALTMVEGEERFDLVRENDRWKIFLNWAAGVKVVFQTSTPRSGGVEATLPDNEVITQTGELFNVVLKIQNRSNQEILARIGHLVEPQEFADYLDLVECGFLLPVRLPPGGKQEEYSSTYLLRGSIPESVRRLVVTYDFKLEK